MGSHGVYLIFRNGAGRLSPLRLCQVRSLPNERKASGGGDANRLLVICRPFGLERGAVTGDPRARGRDSTESVVLGAGGRGLSTSASRTVDWPALVTMQPLMKMADRLGSRPVAVALGFAVVLVVVTVGCGRSADPKGSTTAAPEPVMICNGHVELCERSYDEVAYASTHNAMSVASEPGWLIPEQSDPIPTQLDQGVRGLLIDVWPGRESDSIVITAADRRTLARQIVEQDLGPAALTAAAAISNRLAGSPDGPTSLFLCHGLCEIGSEPFSTMLDSLRVWLEANPSEIVTLFIEDHADARDIADDIIDAGLEPMIAMPPEPDGTWPTLGEMIRTGRRLVVMVENGEPTSNAPWLVNGFTMTQDTPYTFRSVDDFSCAPNRGPDTASLFLVNHWIAGATRFAANSEIANAADVLGDRMRRCREERGQIPNFVAVNFVALGDTFAVVDELNGVD